MLGMDMAEPERTETSRGSSASPKPLPVFFFQGLHLGSYLVHHAVRQIVAGIIQISQTGLGGNDETRWHVQPYLGHFAEVGAFAP